MSALKYWLWLTELPGLTQSGRAWRCCSISALRRTSTLPTGRAISTPAGITAAGGSAWRTSAWLAADRILGRL